MEKWALSDTVEMLQAILRTIDEGIHVVDANGITIFYNHVASRLDGLTPEEVVGRPLLESFPSLNEESSTLLRVIRTGVPIYNQPQRYTNFHGMRVETINTTLPVRVGNRLVGAVEVAKDIRRLRELSERILALQEQVIQPKKGKEGKGHAARFTFQDILTDDEAMAALKHRAQRAARTHSPVFIVGETGTGKELLVQAIHAGSPRANAPFVAQNCAALPAQLLESILFGTVKGSFTGAEDRPGLFEVADGGTLFLDEINSMPLELQAKLLRVLQDGQVRRVGGTTDRQVDVRIVAASNQDPEEAVRQGILRPDLYYRLHVVALEIPPLRERKRDILLLTRHFLDLYNRRFGLRVSGVEEQVEQLFMRYHWPGNVRELQHVMEAAMNMVEGEVIRLEHLPAYLTGRGKRREPSAIRPLREVLKETEERLIRDAMETSRGNIKQAARLLGIPRQTLQYKLSHMEAGQRERAE